MEKFIIDAIKGFTVANLGNEKTLGFLLSSFGQRYLILNEIGNTETDEFKNLEELFNILHLTPEFSDEYGVIFYKKPVKEVEKANSMAVELVAKLERKYSEQVEILQETYKVTMGIAKIKAKIPTKAKARTQDQTQVKAKQLVQAVVVMLSYGQNMMKMASSKNCTCIY